MSNLTATPTKDATPEEIAVSPALAGLWVESGAATNA